MRQGQEIGTTQEIELTPENIDSIINDTDPDTDPEGLTTQLMGPEMGRKIRRLMAAHGPADPGVCLGPKTKKLEEGELVLRPSSPTGQRPASPPPTRQSLGQSLVSEYYSSSSDDNNDPVQSQDIGVTQETSTDL